jgi:hypothetical protein
MASQIADMPAIEAMPASRLTPLLQKRLVKTAMPSMARHYR